MPRPTGAQRTTTSTERPPERPPSERSDRIPGATTSGSRPLAADTDAMVEAFRTALDGALAQFSKDQRDEINKVVRAQAQTMSEAELTQALTLTNGQLRRMRQLAVTAAMTLLLGAASWVTERLTASSVADRTAEAAVERTAERVEEVASAAKVPIVEAKETVDAAAAEREALAAELAALRSELERLRAEKAEPPPKKPR